ADLLHLAPDQDPAAPVVADDELDTPAPRPRPLRPQREPAVGVDTHRRERARERDGKPDAERSRYSFQDFSSLTRKPRGVRRRAISSIMPGCPLMPHWPLRRDGGQHVGLHQAWPGGVLAASRPGR